MKIAQLFLLILAFFIIRPASAGLLVEPYVGYSLASFEIDSAAFSEEKMTGPSMGGRLGYQNLGFQLGLDYLRSSYNVDDNNYKSDFGINEFAGFVGFEFPILLRVYAGYIFAINGTTEYFDGSTTTELEFAGGNGMKVGVGFTGLPFVDIIFEYRTGSFGEYEAGSVTNDIDTNYRAFMMGLSLPFVL